MSRAAPGQAVQAAPQRSLRSLVNAAARPMPADQVGEDRIALGAA